MPSTQNLPQNYRLAGKLDIKHDRKLILRLNAAGLGLTIGSVFFFGWVTSLLRADQSILQFSIQGFADIIKLLGSVVLASVTVILFHEAIHGAFFWLFTGSRPVFAFKGTYAYAAAPGWYLTRGAYMLIGIAPLVLISILGMITLRVAPAPNVTLIILSLVINTSGSVGDLAAVLWLARQPASCLAHDQGDVIEIYLPDEIRSLELN
jgi:hypothetical protein